MGHLRILEKGQSQIPTWGGGPVLNYILTHAFIYLFPLFSSIITGSPFLERRDSRNCTLALFWSFDWATESNIAAYSSYALSNGKHGLTISSSSKLANASILARDRSEDVFRALSISSSFASAEVRLHNETWTCLNLRISELKTLRRSLRLVPFAAIFFSQGRSAGQGPGREMSRVMKPLRINRSRKWVVDVSSKYITRRIPWKLCNSRHYED